jgi:general secretion pathway protein D
VSDCESENEVRTNAKRERESTAGMNHLQDRQFLIHSIGRIQVDQGMIVSPGKISLHALSDFVSIDAHINRATVHRFFCIVMLAIASAPLASAQQGPERPQLPNLQGGNEAKSPSILPIAKGAQPAPSAVQIANPPPTETPPPGAPATVKLQFPNSDVVDVLHMYEQLTGKKLVMDNFVQGKVNIFLTKDVSRDEAIKIIEMSMALNGISLITASRDIVEVVGAGQNPRKAVVPIISDAEEIPPGNPVISFLFKLQYADPQELQQVLMAYFQGSSSSINILALPKSSSLLVTQNADVIRQLASVIQQVDVAPAEVVSEFIKLERADAGKVCDMLKDIFEKGQPTGQPGPGGVRSVRVTPPVPQPVPEAETAALTGLTEEAVVVGKIKLTADVRTNRIHVVTRPINMPFIRKLIHEFDANVEFGHPVARSLRYISAGDVLPVLVQALTEPGTAQAAQPGGPEGGGASPTPPAVRSATATVANPYTGGTLSTSSTATGTTGGTGSTLNISEELTTQPVDTTPKAVTVGNAKLIADQRANAIIVLGSREVVAKVEKILDEMDVKAPQVALSTVIGELTLNNDEEFGVDYFAKYNRRFVGTSRNLTDSQVALPILNASATPVSSPGSSPGPSPAIGSIVDPANLINFSRIIQNVGSGTNIYVAAGNAFAAIVHLLESTSRFKVISRPMVFTSNNKKAIIASGTQIPVPTSSLTNVVGSNVTGTAAVASNIEYKNVVLQLEVVPLINSEKEVSLDILQKIDSLGDNKIISGNVIPTINTRYIRSNVSAGNGSTIVLGGLITDQKQKNYTGIPYLARIPVLGALFRGTTAMHMRTELIVLMCPQVTLTKLDLYRLRQKWENYSHFGPEVDQAECADCPKTETGKQLSLPPPDIPPAKDM